MSERSAALSESSIGRVMRQHLPHPPAAASNGIAPTATKDLLEALLAFGDIYSRTSSAPPELDTRRLPY